MKKYTFTLFLLGALALQLQAQSVFSVKAQGGISDYRQGRYIAPEFQMTPSFGLAAELGFGVGKQGWCGTLGLGYLLDQQSIVLELSPGNLELDAMRAHLLLLPIKGGYAFSEGKVQAMLGVQPELTISNNNAWTQDSGLLNVSGIAQLQLKLTSQLALGVEGHYGFSNLLNEGFRIPDSPIDGDIDWINSTRLMGSFTYYLPTR